MRLSGTKRKIRAQSGFTLIEALVGLLFAATAVTSMSEMLTGLLKRTYMDIEVTRASDESQRFASVFTQAGKTATSWAVYTDKASYLADPEKNVSVTGNVLVFQDQLPDGTLVTELFVYDSLAQTLTRYENGLDQERALLTKVAYSPGLTTVFGQDLGLVQAKWSVLSNYERLDCEAYGTPLRMR
jgi:hypothetical protein